MDAPAWYFIGEFSIDEVNFDELMPLELEAGLLYKALRDCGIPEARIARITRTIAEAIKGVKGLLNDNLSDLPVDIRLFSNKKITEFKRYPEDQMDGAWGYYLIEKGGNFMDTPFRGSRRIMELYLFKEGGRC